MPENASPKNIVICCDGTGNQFGYNNSNVVKIYTASIIDNEQVGYYHPGVGTMGAPTANGKWAQMISRMKGFAFGAGFRDMVMDAYRYLMETYNDGDQIYIFGFSRGAYTARALAGLLHAFGLLCKGNQGHIAYIWQMFTQKLDDMRKEGQTSVPISAEFKETFSHDVKIHFIGLWDTVSSIGWITEPLRLLYLAQNPAIVNGRQAVSIDERRCFFEDNLWGEARPGQDILQIWFAGVHSDVGGSYAQSESWLSNIALSWMLEEAAKFGLRLQEDRVKMLFGQPTEEPHAAADLYKAPNPRFPIHKSLKGFWLLLEILPHYAYDKDDGKEKWSIPLGRSRKIPAGSIVHASVIERMNDAGMNYKPSNLQQSALTPHLGPQAGTSTDLTGHYVYRAGQRAAPPKPE